MGGLALKWVYASLLGLGGALLLLAISVDLSAEAARTLLTVVVTLAAMRVAVGLFWLHETWSSVPMDARLGMTPASAVGMMFVPVLQAYWIFTANTRLCDAIDGVLAREGIAGRAPKALAVTAIVLTIIWIRVVVTFAPEMALFFEVIIGALWLVYMKDCDRARNIMRLALRVRAERALR